MRIMVTGAEGFIGTELCRSLEEKGHEVVRVDNRKWSWHNHKDTTLCDFTDPVILNNIRYYDTVVHAAAQINVDLSYKNIDETFEINAYKTSKLIQKCIEFNKPTVYISSSEIYGSSPFPINEQHPLNGHSPYAASKIAADRLCYAAMCTWPDWKCTIVRPFNTFGPGQRADSYGGVIAKFIAAALKNDPLIVYGDGRQSRDYLYVDDTVRGIIRAVEGRFPSTINLATGRTHRIIDIAQKIIELTESKSQVVHGVARPGEVQCLIGDATLAKSFGWEPRVPFANGLYACLGQDRTYDDELED